MPWRKEDNTASTFAKKKFFLRDEEPIEEKNGIRRESLPYPWNEVSYHILKYIFCEVRLNIVYGYQFRLLYELRFREGIPIERRLNIPYIFLQSIIYMRLKSKREKINNWHTMDLLS